MHYEEQFSFFWRETHETYLWTPFPEIIRDGSTNPTGRVADRFWWWWEWWEITGECGERLETLAKLALLLLAVVWLARSEVSAAADLRPLLRVPTTRYIILLCWFWGEEYSNFFPEGLLLGFDKLLSILLLPPPVPGLVSSRLVIPPPRPVRYVWQKQIPRPNREVAHTNKQQGKRLIS